MELVDTVIFSQDDLMTTSFAAFQDMRKSGKLCDLTIQIRDRTIRAHRVVVAAAIPYFLSLFSTNGNAHDVKQEIVLEDFDPELLDILIDFAYSTKVEISTTNVQSLLMTAQLLQLHQVQEACIQFLSQRLHINNVLQVHDFAIRIKNSDLDENVNRFIKDNFQELIQCEDFLRLSSSCLTAVISQDDLNVTDEETVFEAIIKWVKKSTSRRQHVLPDLFSEIRLTNLPLKYLIERVSEEDLVRDSKSCSGLLDKVKNYHLMQGQPSLCPTLKTSPRKRVRVSDNCGQYLYSVFERETVCVNRYDFVNNTWEPVMSHFRNDDFWYAVFVNDTVYMFFDETIVTLDIKSMQWIPLEPRHEYICGSAVLAHGNIIYFVGSFSNKISDDVVRRFSTVENKWLLTQIHLTTERYGPGLAVLNNSIYITGGYDVPNYSGTVEEYNTVTGQCSSVASMLDARRWHGSTSINGKIYVCGGESDFKPLCTAEVYDPLTNKWNYISPMNIKRRKLSMLCKDDQLYAIGGVKWQDEHSVREMEIYDVQSNQWTSRILLPEEGYPADTSYFFFK